MKTNDLIQRCGNPRMLPFATSLLLCLPLTLLAQITLLFEDFEGAFPGANAWGVFEANPNGPHAYWDDVDSNFGGEGAHTGN